MTSKKPSQLGLGIAPQSIKRGLMQNKLRKWTRYCIKISSENRRNWSGKVRKKKNERGEVKRKYNIKIASERERK